MRNDAPQQKAVTREILERLILPNSLFFQFFPHDFALDNADYDADYRDYRDYRDEQDGETNSDPNQPQQNLFLGDSQSSLSRYESFSSFWS